MKHEKAIPRKVFKWQRKPCWRQTRRGNRHILEAREKHKRSRIRTYLGKRAVRRNSNIIGRDFKFRIAARLSQKQMVRVAFLGRAGAA